MCAHYLERLDWSPVGVDFLEQVEDEDTPAVVSGASTVVYPSFAESNGLPVYEGMACGVPVVTADLPVYQEILQARPPLVFIDPSNPSDIARGIADALCYDHDDPRILASRTAAERLKKPGGDDLLLALLNLVG